MVWSRVEEGQRLQETDGLESKLAANVGSAKCRVVEGQVVIAEARGAVGSDDALAGLA